MKRIIFLITLFAGVNTVYAQSDIANECQQAPSSLSPKLELIINDLKVDTTYTSKELLNLRKNYKIKPSDVILGLFIPTTFVSIKPEIYSVTLNNSPICVRIKSAVVKYELNPTIYIAKEAMQLSCTKQRVYKHELIHYNIELSAINKLKDFINTSVSPNLYKINFIQPNNINMASNIIKTEMDKIGDFVNAITEPENALMDSPENYQAESDLCPGEKNALNVALINGRNAPISYRATIPEVPSQQKEQVLENSSKETVRTKKSNNTNYQNSPAPEESFRPAEPSSLFK